MTPIVGKLSEIYRRKKLLLIIMTLYTFSGIFCNTITYLLEEMRKISFGEHVIVSRTQVLKQIRVFV
jgi:hypothetical protein